MSNLEVPPGGDLFRHERTHVWQGRAFGPIYTLSYIGWIVLWVIPSVVVGVISMGASGIVKGPNDWCYFNNPWEAWAYAVQGADRTNIEGVTVEDQKMIWPVRFVVAWAIPFFILCLGLSSFTAYKVWGAPATAAQTQSQHAPVPGHAPKPKH